VVEHNENLIRYKRSGEKIKIWHKLEPSPAIVFDRDYFAKYGAVRSLETNYEPDLRE
jgi:hypothetical protein